MKKLLLNAVLATAWLYVSPAEAGAKRWVTTHSWSGRGTRCTELFLVNADRAQIRYRPGGAGPFRLALLDENGDLLRNLTDQKPSNLLRGKKRVPRRGWAYLRIAAPGTDWTVELDQQVSIIEEWHLLQLAKQKPKGWVKLGTWTGGEGEQIYDITLPTAPWRAVCTVAGEESADVGIFDADGLPWFFAVVDSERDMSTWVHKSGTFSLAVRAGNTSWRVEIFAREK